MGRVKHYATMRSSKKKHLKKQRKTAEPEAITDETEPKVEQALTVGKKKQIFKKEKAKGIKAKIQELKIRSLKLKKKNLEQKAEKKKIAKEIHRLKACLKKGEVDQEDEAADAMDFD